MYAVSAYERMFVRWCQMEAVTQHELGQRIADARRGKGWTQGQLAERVGLTQTAVSRIETGTRAALPSTRAGDLPDRFAGS
jgi:ribosome-binding protein aMBF1 (putative translation factor)